MLCRRQTNCTVLKVPCETNEGWCRGERSVLGELPGDSELTGNLVNMAKIVCVRQDGVARVL
jgi:hypothetical protein